MVSVPGRKRSYGTDARIRLKGVSDNRSDIPYILVRTAFTDRNAPVRVLRRRPCVFSIKRQEKNTANGSDTRGGGTVLGTVFVGT